MKKSMIALAGLCLFATAATADESRKYPGSSGGSISNTAPSEKGNVLATVQAEQGMVVAKGSNWKLVPYVSGGVTVDSKGHDWNNKALLHGGLKLVLPMPHGTVALRLGVAHEERFKSRDSYSSTFVSAEHWFGWGYGTRFPGSTGGALGYGASPAEADNVMLRLYGEQGLFAMEHGKGRVVPFVSAVLVRDSKGHNWNNKNELGVGVKYSLPVTKSGVFNVGVKHTYEKETRSGASASQTGVFVNYWIGW